MSVTRSCGEGGEGGVGLVESVMALVEKHHCDVGSLPGSSGGAGSRSFRFRVTTLAPLAIAAFFFCVAVAHGFWLGAVWTLATLFAWFFVRGAAAATGEESELRARRDP